MKLAELYAEDIARVRRGDVAAAQTMMRACAEALRELRPDGTNNLAGQYAVYLAQVLARLARNPDTARLFCLGRPANRPKALDDSLHRDRARRVLARLQRGGGITAAIEAVAKADHVSPGAMRASWKAAGFLAKVELLARTPKDKRKSVRLAARKKREGT